LSAPVSSISNKVKLGSRAAASLLMNGWFPKQWLKRTGGVRTKKLVWPIPGRKLGRGYGSDGGRHLAVDITTPTGTPIRVAAQGVVGYANDGVRGYGKMMLVLHPGGWVTQYAHLSRYKFRPGKKVSRGQIIAASGNTGISRGPHLHFALFIKGKPVDPVPYMIDMPRRHLRVSSLSRPFL
jgi:murein DD-endopeptidase MepM/ murein hydrolase activator NlpD